MLKSAFCAALLVCCSLAWSGEPTETGTPKSSPSSAEKQRSQKRQKAGKAAPRKKKSKKGTVDDRAFYGA